MKHVSLHRMKRALAALVAMAVPASMSMSMSGCDGAGVSLSSAVAEPRILAVSAEPPVVALGQESELVPLIAGLAQGQELDLALRACNPWRVISDPTSDCGPDASLPLPGETFALGRGARLSTNDLLDAFPPPDWYEPTPPDPGSGGTSECAADSYPHVAVTIVVEAHVDGRRLLATKSVRVTLEPVPRQNPAIVDMLLDDALSPTSFTPGQRHTLMAMPHRDSLDAICDPDGQPILEPVRVYFYANAGELADPYIDITYTAEGQESLEPTAWTAPQDGDASIWVVALDDDGGTGWRRFDLAPGSTNPGATTTTE